MPIAADPNARRTYVLVTDRARPADQQARFYFRFLTRRQKREYLRIGRENDQLAAARGADGVIRAVYEALAGVLAGWDGLVDPKGEVLLYPQGKVGPDRLAVLDGCLTDVELWELYWAGASEIDEGDLGNSASPRSSGPGECAPAGAAAETATTPPATTAPSSTNAQPAAEPAAILALPTPPAGTVPAASAG